MATKVDDQKKIMQIDVFVAMIDGQIALNVNVQPQPGASGNVCLIAINNLEKLLPDIRQKIILAAISQGIDLTPSMAPLVGPLVNEDNND